MVLGRKPAPDLSQRQQVPAPPLPTFSPRFYITGSKIAAASPLALCTANAAITVQWITLSVAGAVSVQLLENGRPASLLYTATGAAVIRFPGRFLSNNTILTVSLSTAVNVSWEIVYVKEFIVGLISLDSKIESPGQAAASGVNTDVNIFDSNGNVINASAGAIEVDIVASTTVPVSIAGTVVVDDIGGILNATGQVAIGTAATLIIAANVRRGILVTNPSSTVTVFVGGAAVTTANGQELLPLASLTIPTVSAVYGIVAAATQTVSYMEIV